MRATLSVGYSILLASAIFAVRAAERPDPGVAVKVASPVAPGASAPVASSASAKRVELGGGVTLELVEIPAGKFIMGATEPTPEARWVGFSIAGGGGGIALLLVAVMLLRAIRERSRPQFSLLWYMTLVLSLGVTMLGVQRSIADARTWTEYRVSPDELPPHPVQISKAFLMGRCEVTQEQFQKIMGTNPSFFISNTSTHQPVDRVTWNEAVDFCTKLSEKTHQTFRLPTEAEWEYACRAGSRTRYYFGDDEQGFDRNAWHDGTSANSTHDVGQLAPNAWDLCDMHGNVMEWCQDWYDENYYHPQSSTDPRGPASGETRVIRGGAWLTQAAGCRDSSRLSSLPEKRSYGVGFRVVAEP